MNDTQPIQVGRRAFLERGTLFLAAAGLGSTFANAAEESTGVSFGVITDLHYADKASAGSRCYRETLDKIAEAGKQFAKDKPDFVLELGDLIDAADTVETELGYLKRIYKEFSALSKNRYCVLGNHCVDMLTKQEFLDGVEQKKSYYSFDHGNVHFIVLDACFSANGKPYGRKSSKWNDANVPKEQIEWLTADLKEAKKPVILFAHQRLDVTNDYRIKNAEEIRKILEASGKVLAVFGGHSHKNEYKEIAGIHYCTLVAMVEGTGVENNGYSLVSVDGKGSITLKGFRKQKEYSWAKK